MGFEPLELGLLHYANQLGIGVTDLNNINVHETAIEDVSINFKPHEWVEQQNQWHEPNAMADIHA